ncbi:MAG: nucleotidyl transferase AbiEii/AbiGii toxin family protein [Bacteroidota bacterium]
MTNASLDISGKFDAEVLEIIELLISVCAVQNLIPFGAIEEPEGKISWPPNFDHVMSTVGFQDALNSAQVCRVRNDPPKEIRVVSIPGIAVLKLIAWADGYPSRSKDAIDFRFILENYSTGQFDRLFSDEESLIDLVTSEHEMAVARLLGRDAGRTMNPATRKVVLGILEAEQNTEGQLRLVGDMLVGSDQGADFVLALIKHFRQGISDASA